VRRSSSRVFFGEIRKRCRLRQQHCLEVASRPVISAWVIGRVGLIDITVGNAARLGASQRSTTRRCASHQIATQSASRWEHPRGSRAFSADGLQVAYLITDTAANLEAQLCELNRLRDRIRRIDHSKERRIQMRPLRLAASFLLSATLERDAYG